LKEEVIRVLMSWALFFTEYEPPHFLPTVEYQSHAWFVEHACHQAPCAVIGWYRNTDIIYLDEKFKGDESSYAAALVVHEMTHYLQHHSGKFDRRSCKDHLAREVEAYTVQNAYLVAAGSPALVFRQPAACPE